MLGELGLLDARQGRLEDARRGLTDGEALLRAVGDPGVLGGLLAHRAEVEHLAGDPDAARAALAAATDLAEQVSAGPDSELGERLAEVRALLGVE